MNILMIGYIYILENLISGKMYTGQTVDPYSRLLEHFSVSSKCPAIAAAIRKYGKENFDFIILESCNSQESLNEREIYWIKELNSLAPNGYNLKEGGQQGGSPSEETRRRISKSLRGYKHSEETKIKLSMERKKRFSDKINHPFYGKKFTDDHKRNLSLSHRGSKHWSYGKKMKPESIALMRKNRAGKGMGPKSIETKIKIAEAHQSNSNLNWYVVTEIRNKYEEGNISQRYLASQYNISQAQIGNILRNKCWKED